MKIVPQRLTWPSLSVALPSSDSIANPIIWRLRQNHSMGCLALSLNPEQEQRHFASNQIPNPVPRNSSVRLRMLLVGWHLPVGVHFRSIG